MKGALLSLSAGVLGLAALASPALGLTNGQNGTTLEASVTASTDRVREHQWTLSKTASRTSLDMFRGDSAAVTYTLTATDTGTVEKAWLTGTVSVVNVGAVVTQDLTIVVVASTTGGGPTIGSASVDTSANPALDPLEVGTYAYRVAVPVIAGATYKATANITISNHSGSLGVPEGPSPSNTTLMTSTVRDTNTQVDVDDSNGQSFAFTSTGSRSYATTFACDKDQGQKVNTATIRQTSAKATATVTVSCYALSVTTNAATRLTRTWSWNVAKSADATSVTLEPDGSSATVNYALDVSATSADSDWGVSGSVVVTNPAPIAASLASVAAALPVGAASTSCPQTSVAANGSLTCTYDRALASAASTSVTATATLQNTPSGTTAFGASADVTFSGATITEVGKTATIVDTAGAATRTFGPLSPSGASRLTYSMKVGPYAKCGPYTFTNTATLTASSGATKAATVSLPVTVKCYQLTVSGTAATALTRTYGWTIAKQAGAPSLALEPGAAGELGFTVDVSGTPTDSAWAANGGITVKNPAPVAASLASLTASAAGTGATLAGCPNSVPAGGQVDCTWSASLTSATGGPLALLATLADDSAFTAPTFGSATSIDFTTAAVTEVDKTVGVKDVSGTNTRDLGNVTAGSGGHFTYGQTVGAYSKCGSYLIQNTATFTAPSGATGSASTSTPVSVKCYDLGASASAKTALTRTYTWNVAKTANAASLTLAAGQAGSIDYTVTLSSTSQDSAWAASGKVVVTNPAPVATSLSGVTANVGAVTCPTLALAAGGSVECSWTATFTGASNGTVAVTATLADSGAFNSAAVQASAALDFASATVTEIDKTATLRDVMGTTTKDFGPASAGQPTTYAYAMPVGPYPACTNTSVENRATFKTATTSTTGTAKATTAVSVPCAQLGLGATAGTSLTRTYAWQIAKSADQTALTLEERQIFSVNYTVRVSATSADSLWKANGTITLTTPAGTGATLSSVAATAAGAPATVSCPSLSIAAGGTLTCAWSAALGSATSGTLNVTATLADASAFDHPSYAFSTPFSFAGATVTEVDKTVSVTDTANGSTRALGSVSAGDPGTFTYAQQVGPYADCGQYTFTNTAAYGAPSGKSGSASATVAVNVPCTGCTLTIGYWKNHAGLGPQADMMLGKLPVSLGTVGGAKTVTVTTESQAVAFLDKYGDASNGINKLYAQLLAAKLNILAGASSSAVATTIAKADAFLATKNALDWGKLGKTDRNNVLAWATTLDQYNTGQIGPGHCSQ